MAAASSSATAEPTVQVHNAQISWMAAAEEEVRAWTMVCTPDGRSVASQRAPSRCA